MTDFNIMNKALKVAWIPRFQTRSDTCTSWKIIPEIALENYGGRSFLTYCNYDINALQINHLPGLYHEVLKHWQNTKQAFEKDTSPHNEIIWNNRNIKTNGKAPFYKNWFEKILYILKTSFIMTVISFPLINFPENFILKCLSIFIFNGLN